MANRLVASPIFKMMKKAKEEREKESQQVSLSIKYSSSSKDDKFIYLNFLVEAKKLNKSNAIIHIKNLTNSILIPDVTANIQPNNTTSIKIKFDKMKIYSDGFFLEDNYEVSINCGGIFSTSDKFTVKFNTISLWEKIYANYPKPYENKPCKENYFNQCAIRMSIALMGAGIKLDGVKNKSNPGGKVKCSHGHVLGAYNLKEYIVDEKLFGKAIDYNGMSNKNVLKDVLNKTGILFFESFIEEDDNGIQNRSSSNRHIEVWNGQYLISRFDEQMFDSKKILFWEIK